MSLSLEGLPAGHLYSLVPFPLAAVAIILILLHPGCFPAEDVRDQRKNAFRHATKKMTFVRELHAKNFKHVPEGQFEAPSSVNVLSLLIDFISPANLSVSRIALSPPELCMPLWQERLLSWLIHERVFLIMQCQQGRSPCVLLNPCLETVLSDCRGMRQSNRKTNLQRSIIMSQRPR